MGEGLILGIDPGTTIMGFALLDIKGKKSEVIDIGIVKMVKLSDHNAKLKKVLESTVELIEKYEPTTLAIEAPFYGKNPQSMLKLGRAQGVVIAICLQNGLEVFEYAPRKIKQSITGKGNSSKEQVAAMLGRLCAIPENQKYLDATDALAVAYCHHLQNRITINGKKFSGWENFLANNEDRVIK